jgi:hypothetical protein
MDKLFDVLLPLGATYLASQAAWTPAEVLVLRVAAACVLAAQLAMLAAVARAVAARRDGTAFAYFTPKKDAAGVPIPDDARDPDDAVVTSAWEYDASQVRREAVKAVATAAALAGVHVWLHWHTPMAVAVLTTPYALAGAPLVNIHLLGRPAAGAFARPFAAKAGARSLLSEFQKEWAEIGKEPVGGGGAGVGRHGGPPVPVPVPLRQRPAAAAGGRAG